MKRITLASLLALASMFGGAAQAQAATPAPTCVTIETHYQALVAAPYMGALAATATGATERVALYNSFVGVAALSRLPIC